MEGPVRGNVLLRRQQYRAADDPAAAASIVRTLLSAKVANTRTVVLRAAREDATAERRHELAACANGLAATLRTLGSAATFPVDELRGMEGDAARAYFGAFDALITPDDTSLHFSGRSRRPPLDPVNAVLSFLYTLLTHDCAGALESVGLDPAVGFLHADRPGRPSLALDLVEEFRAPLADRLALSLLNRRQLRERHFDRTASGAVWLSDVGRKIAIQAWQERKRESLQHPYLDEACPWGLLPYTQALLLARHLRGDLDAYPAFFWR